jgi:hypothetical protein
MLPPPAQRSSHPAEGMLAQDLLCPTEGLTEIRTAVKGKKLDHWHVEVIGSGQVWDAIDDDGRAPWVTHIDEILTCERGLLWAAVVLATSLLIGVVEDAARFVPTVGDLIELAISLLTFYFHRIVLVTDHNVYVYRDWPFHIPGKQLAAYPRHPGGEHPRLFGSDDVLTGVCHTPTGTWLDSGSGGPATSAVVGRNRLDWGDLAATRMRTGPRRS